MSLMQSSAFIGCLFLNASGPRLTFWYSRSSTAVYRRTFAHSLMLLIFQVAEDFAVPAVTASSSIRFNTPLLAAKHFQSLALRCGTACHRRLRLCHLCQPSALDSKRFCSLSRILTFSYVTFCVYTLSIVDLAVFQILRLL